MKAPGSPGNPPPPRHGARLAALALLVALFQPAAASAHPHVWVDAASEVVFDASGQIVAIRHHWRFDEAFSVYALQGLDVDRDGAYSAEELEPLARENVESLSDFGFFTFLSTGDRQVGFAAPRDDYLELSDGRLLLHFTLPLAQPLSAGGSMLLEVFDPEYYVAFALPSVEAVRLVGAPAACKLTVHPAREPDAAAAQALATIGPDQRELPPELKELATGIENSAEIACPAAVGALTPDAAERLARADGESGDLAAPPAAARSRPSEPPSAASGGVMGRIAAWQAAFNRDLTAALKSLKDGGAFWWLGGISLLYGIVHAAGPGHGKLVISSYLVANEARLRRGVAIAFVAAFAQAVVAVALIGAMAAILNMTSMAITGTAKLFEAGSFALVAALGLYLSIRKGRQAWALFAGTRHARAHGCGAHHGDDHGHRHHPVATDARPGLSGAAAAIVSVGIRPCSGALVVLVFALAQGVFWAGIASTFLMALGAAVTVAALAALAVGAKDVARRLASGGGQRPVQIMLGLELAAALFIAALGAALLAGALYA